MSQYWIGRDGQRFGPYSADVIRTGFSRGKILASDLVWSEGMPDWTPVGTLFGATAAVPTPAEAPASTAGEDPSRSRPEAAAPPTTFVVDSDLSYGGFWARLAAAFIDGFVMLIPIVVLSAIPVIGWLGAVVAAWLYFALMESGERGATLGKRAMRLQVVSADGAERIGFGRATGRFFGRYLSMLLFYAGYLIQPFTARKQALHDMVSGTVVVSRGPAPGGVAALVIGVLVALPIVGGILAAISIPAYQDYQKRVEGRKALASNASTQISTSTPQNTAASSLALSADERTEVDRIKRAGQTAGILGHEIGPNVRLFVLTDNFGENPTCVVAVRAHDERTGQQIHPNWDLNVQVAREGKLVYTKNYFGAGAGEIRLMLLDSGRRYSLNTRMRKPGYFGADFSSQLARDLLSTKQAKAVSGLMADNEFSSHYDLSHFGKAYKYALAVCPY